MEQVATYPVPVYIAGDFNIRVDRPDDAHAVQLRQLVDCYGLLLHDSDTTHQLGGTLDAVITRDDVGPSADRSQHWRRQRGGMPLFCPAIGGGHAPQWPGKKRIFLLK